MPDRLTVAIVGAGQIAGGFDLSTADGGVYTHAGAYREDGRFLLESVCDTDPKRGEEFRKEWGVGRAVTDPEEIYRSRHDVVSLCTPDATHFGLIRNLIVHRACRTIFAEKPLALHREEIAEVERLARENGVHVVVNFQRRFEPAHGALREELASGKRRVLSGSAHYMKGLDHNGVTMVDTLTFLCGVPRAVQALRRVYNEEVRGYTYEFLLLYDDFSIVVQTVDCAASAYHYHIFEIDLLLSDGRVAINDNARQLVCRGVTGYAYSGVRVLDDQAPRVRRTGFSRSMVAAVEYLYDISTGARAHSVNTPAASLQTKIIIDSIISSYQKAAQIEIGARHGEDKNGTLSPL